MGQIHETQYPHLSLALPQPILLDIVIAPPAYSLANIGWKINLLIRPPSQWDSTHSEHINEKNSNAPNPMVPPKK